MNAYQKAASIDGLKSRLLANLKTKLSRETYLVDRRKIELAGFMQWDQLINDLKEKEITETDFLQEVNLPKSTLIRIIGFGMAFSDKFLPLTENERRPELVKLGALSNLIVCLYDHIVDTKNNDEDPLSRPELERVDFVGTPGAKPGMSRMEIYQLIQLYFRKLKNLCTGPDDLEVYQLINKTALKMYDAERATVRINGVDGTSGMRKSALPFVLMGMPGWVFLKQSTERWLLLIHLYRVGLFFGILDDIVDYRDDLINHQFNLLLTYSEKEMLDLEGRLIHQIDALSFRGSLNEQWVRLYYVCAISWLGGYE
ncbi:hypothetical protein LZZ85_00125 [Terrimonas sp. NA20]|uniref:Terpene synthase n=1 Tax=Terrimonas ginsenosidimutans TaxID=2908004 RepID=A0ABS9KK10_9BACT|nr:hypothetical protein [Terrimonas ginsenosidimutans]MCG2612655.1 hypothetical protein [Terrimonas ginsenosidimutans]